jgi:hypothetical protein
MPPFYHRKALIFLLGLGVGLSMPFSGLEAQSRSRPRELDRTQFGIGYVANAPDVIVGGMAYVVVPKWGGIGLFVDAKFDSDNPSDLEEYEPDLTAEQVPNEVVGANFLEFESSYHSFNVGVVRPLSPFLMVYAGGGPAFRTRYVQYTDPQKNYGRGGVFWVEDPRQDETRMNLMLGLMMRVGSRITSQFGFETQPRGVTVGLSLRLPSW